MARAADRGGDVAAKVASAKGKRIKAGKTKGGGDAKSAGAWKAGKKKKAGARGGGGNPEEREIAELEQRLKTEAPQPGSGAVGVDGGGSGGHAGGPALTGGLFKDLPISKRTKIGLAASQYTRMTEIQRSAIPHALCGRDLFGEARTGSGKTLAFLVPLVELLFRRRWSQMDGLGALVVSPTRELSFQIFQVLGHVGKEHEFSAGCIVGGRDVREEQDLVRTMNVLIATPGRLLQHLDESPGFDAGNLQMLVLDEADRILDFGFRDTVNHILGHLPSDRQTLLFSATLHTSVHSLGRAALRSPEMVSVHKDATSRTPDRLKQVHMLVPLEKKVDTLFSFLRSHSQKKTIVFVSSCKQVRFFYEAFRKLKPGPAVMELHGRQSLEKRMLIFKEFTDRERAVALFCTDIAARGVDFPAVDWVVQLDCPDSVESYIHRVGRTARYESSGNSALFLGPSEAAFADKLKAARIAIKSIATKQGKVQSISQKLNALLAGDGAIKHLAQKAYTSYLRSVALMKDKDVFKLSELPREDFAASLGLAVAPELKGLEENGTADPSKKEKNKSALQRLKDKIKAKKQAGKDAAAGGAATSGKKAPDDGEDEEAREEREELQGAGEERGEKKKLGRWERRQRRILAASEAAKNAPSVADEADEDDLLRPVASTSASSSATVAASTSVADERELEVAAASRRTSKLRIGRDGVAHGATGKHTFFSGKAGVAGSELAQLSEELRGEGFNGEEESGGRESFIQRVAKDLAKRDSSDAAVSRARIHERHQQQKRKARQARRGEDSDDGDDGGGVVLGGASGSDSDAGGGASDDGASRSPSPAPMAAGKRKKGAGGEPARKRGRFGGAASPTASPAEAPAQAPAARRKPPTASAGGALDELGALEREALARLGGGGLFG